jgi:positive regulator of sigma E activity
MKETATVLEIEGTSVLCKFHEQEGCKSCKNIFCKAGDRVFTAENRNGLDVHPGDTVVVYLQGGKTIQSTFIVLIAPLILFILFFLLAQGGLKLENEIVKIGFGFIGLALGFLVSFLVSRKGGKTSMPLIVEQRPAGTIGMCEE